MWQKHRPDTAAFRIEERKAVIASSAFLTPVEWYTEPEERQMNEARSLLSWDDLPELLFRRGMSAAVEVVRERLTRVTAEYVALRDARIVDGFMWICEEAVGRFKLKSRSALRVVSHYGSVHCSVADRLATIGFNVELLEPPALGFTEEVEVNAYLAHERSPADDDACVRVIFWEVVGRRLMQSAGDHRAEQRQLGRAFATFGAEKGFRKLVVAACAGSSSAGAFVQALCAFVARKMAAC